VLAPLGRDAGGRRVAQTADRPAIRLVAFAALALYGALRWGTLMTPAPTWRLLGLVALSVALVGIGPVLLERERSVAVAGGRSESLTVVGAPLALLVILAAFPLAGVPLSWILHLRVAVTADAIGQGLSALPDIYVPYSGINDWVRVAILLGAVVLLLDAAMLLAFAPRALGDVRRAGAALPLIALVVVPAVSLHPRLAYLQGLELFALLAFFMWGERVPPDRRGGVVLACAAAGALGMIIAPAIDQHSPWINTQALARGFTPTHVAQFDWTQRYGPLIWPQSGTTVLEVKATPAAWPGEYWKAENLDTFDGRGWAAGGPPTAALPPVSLATIARSTQTLTVTLRSMQTTQVIAAGTALQAPAHLPGPALPGTSAGTFTSETLLAQGATYTVQVYTPHPSGARLAAAGTSYPLEVRRADLTLTLPQASSTIPHTVLFSRFGSRPLAPVDETSPAHPNGLTAIQNSPYAQAYATAQRLARASATPYAYVERVLAFLANGYTYYQSPPPSRYPLETFLFSSRYGYCQQFAGAMALLLRMGGVPARVSTGFTTGLYDTATKRWVVSDIDAHAWVEAWFPGYGWVKFDPTPPVAPALGGSRQGINSGGVLGGAGGLSKLGGRDGNATGGSAAIGPRAGHQSAVTPVVLAILGVLVTLLVLALVAWTRSGPLDADGMLAELERALARSGRPIADGVTLAALERRFRTSPGAAGYVRALRMTRFGGDTALPTLGQRRALRAQLRAGLGLGGALRALWALPPRPEWRRRRRRQPS
jgi:transglutaminase-like putative cysteine protease